MDIAAEEMQQIYRHFRARIIGDLRSDIREASPYGSHPHPFSNSRKKIERFRSRLALKGEEILRANPAAADNLRKALRIPPDVPLLPSRSALFFQHLLQLCPPRWTVQRAKAILMRIGTHEGRSLAYDLQVRHTFIRSQYFSNFFDYALRHLVLPSAAGAFFDMRELDLNWVKASVRLGEREYAAIRTRIDKFSGHIPDGRLVLALVESQVITEASDLDLIPRQHHTYSSYLELDNQKVQQFRHIAAMLKTWRVPTSSIVTLVNFPLHRLDADRLTQAHAVFNFSGPELGFIINHAGYEVLFSGPSGWLYVRDVLGVITAEDAVRFKRLLATDRKCGARIATVLRQAGADLSALAACQGVLLAVGDKPELEESAIVACGLLITLPHALSFFELALAEDYILHDRDLPAFLQVLIAYGYGDCQAVFAFQRVYKILRAEALANWLTIAAQPARGQAAAAVAEWVQLVAPGGHVGAFKYLEQAGEITTFSHLHQAIKLAPLGATLLRYVREVRGRKGLKALQEWYFKEAPGVREVKLWDLDVVSRILLDDAFERKDFTLFEGNRACVNEVVREQITQQFGTFPFDADDATRTAFRRNTDASREQLSADIAPKLKIMMRHTGGVLLPSLMPHVTESEEVMSARVAALTALLEDLLEGIGPSRDMPSPLEIDAIAMVYRTDPSTISVLWPQITGRQKDVAPELAAARYAMAWHQMEVQLDGQVDQRGLQAVLIAIDFAVRFTGLYQTDMFGACRHLKPTRLRDAARDVWSLAQHLGLLMAVGSADRNIRNWLERGAQNLRALMDGTEQAALHLKALENLFKVDLRDALNATCDQFVAGLSSADAARLASKIDVLNEKGSADGLIAVRRGLSSATDVVLKQFCAWIRVQEKRLISKDISGMCTVMTAMVSKSPSAFFAKEAAAICTRANTAMWREARHAHLLVFAPYSKRLAGMALLYFEKITALDAKHNTLIIRAINPMPEALASFSIASIVDAYFDVAISIAKDSGCAAVAFPHPAGMHLMSNHQGIEDYLKARFIARTGVPRYGAHAEIESPWLEKPRLVSADFFAYESGVSPVQNLYGIWHRAADDGSGHR